MARTNLATLRRFIRECRRLAYECAEGTAPPLGQWDFGAPCALGLALKRSTPSGSAWDAFHEIGAAVPYAERLPESAHSTRILIDANNLATDNERHAAVVFPLLYVADCGEKQLARLLAPPPKASEK